MLRVLVVLPFYGGSLPVGRFAAEGLKEAGCLVDIFEAPSFFPAYTALKELRVSSNSLDTLQNSFLQMVAQAVLAKVESFAPDLVLCLAQAPMSRLALRQLRKQGIPTAMWFVEDFRLFTYWRAFAPYYDLFAVIQKEPFSSELAAIGQTNVLYLPLAALPSFHRPLELGPKERKEFGSALSFLGAGYPNRRKAFMQLRQLPDSGLKIWGTEWEDEPGLTPLVQRRGMRISPEDAVCIFNATDININLHSSIHTDKLVSAGDFVNPRTFEVAACGAFQLVDQRSLLPELFSDEEMAVFSSMEDLREKIVHFKAHPEERQMFAARARERVLKEHTYAERMGRLLDFARERLPGFGKREPLDWPPNMPESMREGITALLLELQLPENVGFDDLITAVRAKSDRLSDVETALLFMDEWKKQYLK
jgi:spore maturation protein CgeB